ncbi:hypothetical protein CEXT_113451 [Caerostris extrusa]|uniref:Uncharacterized protein n=1 Tax=Caerostris extrusa TaxID=172846 RepID=A0AAV4Q3C3_CAEEX|nr:hypothetical protein CEXT_113451 [Caerostris extrusa]
MNFSTSRSRAANKLSKGGEEEKKKRKKKEKWFTSWIFRYLVYSCCKVVWKCSDEYRELNLMPISLQEKMVYRRNGGVTLESP